VFSAAQNLVILHTKVLHRWSKGRAGAIQEKKIGEEVYQSHVALSCLFYFLLSSIKQHTVRYYVFILRHNLKVKAEDALFIKNGGIIKRWPVWVGCNYRSYVVTFINQWHPNYRD
jgi:hypothetical protein